jgi:hypothetical protein
MFTVRESKSIKKQRRMKRMINKWSGMYEYKGFTVWCPSEDGKWIAEPHFESDVATDHYKWLAPSFRTIASAKKWIREHGATIKESDFMDFENVKKMKIEK